MILSLCLLLAQSAPAIDFEHKGAPVERVVAAMAKAYGEPMIADVTMRQDYVVLALRNETAERARALTAEALNATWTKKDDVWILHRTSAQSRSEAAEALQKKVGMVRRMQEALHTPPRVIGDRAREAIHKLIEVSIGNEERFGTAAPELVPFNRCVVRLIKELPAEFWATRLTDEYNLFAMDGGLVVWQLPSRAREILAEWLNDQSALAELLTAQAATIALPFELRRADFLPEDILLRISGANGIHLADATVERNGVSHGKFDFFAEGLLNRDQLLAINWPDKKHLWGEGFDAIYEESRLAEEWFQMNMDSMVSLAKQPSQALVDVFERPPDHDPFEIQVDQVVTQASRASGKSFVMSNPGQTFMLEHRVSRLEGSSLSIALDAMISHLSFRIEESARDVVIVPRDPIMARELNYDRRAFATAFRALKKRSMGPLLESAGDLFASTTKDGRIVSAGRLMRIARTPIFDLHEGLDALALYGHLSVAQRHAARSGGIRIQATSLSLPAQEVLKSILKEAAYSGVDYGYMLRNYTRDSEANWDYSKEIVSATRTHASDLHIEIVAGETLATFIRRDAQGQGAVTSPSQSAFGSIEDLIETGVEPEKQFALVPELSVVVFLLTNDARIPLTATYMHPDLLDADFVGLKEMPQDFQDAYAAEIKEARMLFGIDKRPPPPQNGGGGVRI